MSLNKSQLVNALIAVFTNEQTEETDANNSVDRIANGIANAVDAFVKSGQVNVTVSTTGTAAAQTGTGTGTIT
jgi:hypothetical protein